MNSEPFKLWKLTSSQQSQRHNFFGCSNSPILDSNRTVLVLCPSGPLHPKLGLTTLIVNNLFTRNPNLEEQVAYQLGTVRTENHGKSFEGRQCSKLLSCSAILKELVPSSDHPLVECLAKLHSVVVGVFGQILDPEFENDARTFEETLMGAMRTHNPRITPKVHVLVHHVPEYVRPTGVQLGPTSEQAPANQYRLLIQIQSELHKLTVSRKRLLNAVLL